jgi:hypothetical protein
VDAQRIANKWERDTALRLGGVIDHAADRRAQQLRKPIAEHVADFMKDLIARQNTEKHVKDTIGNFLIIEMGDVEFVPKVW